MNALESKSRHNPCPWRECSLVVQRRVQANTYINIWHLRKGGMWCCEDSIIHFYHELLIEPRSEGKSEIRLSQYHVFQILKSNFLVSWWKTRVALVLSKIKDFKTIFNSFDVKIIHLQIKEGITFKKVLTFITLCIGIIRLQYLIWLKTFREHLLQTRHFLSAGVQ